jgi:hypothetical protein
MTTNKPSLQMYDQLYLKTGIRVASQLMQARAIPQEKFALPKGAIYHYVDPQGSTIGPLPADSLFAAFPKNLFVTYVQSFYDDHISKAKYRILPGLWDERSPSTEIKHYHHVNKRMRRVVNFDQTLMDINAPLIISYARIPKHYEYMDNMYRKLYQWEDLYNTVFRKIQEISENKLYPNTRHQFISIEVPGVLVPYSFIESSIKQGITTTHMPKISNDGQRLMTHLLWMFSSAKNESVFRHIKARSADKITFLFTYAGKVAVLNYGMLLSMCENKDYDDLYYKKKSPMLEVQMRKYLYLMFMNLIGQTHDIDEGEEIDQKADSNNNLEQAIKLTEETDLDTTISNEVIAAIDEAISDSENLSEIKVITTLEKQPTLESVSKAFEKQVQRSIVTGSITSSKQIAAITELSNKYEEIKLTDGKTLKDVIKVSEESKIIKPSNINADITTITDPSMHYNNVETIHSQYVSKVMRPHILSSIVGIQRAGVLVEDIKEEDVSDVTGEITHISVSLNPIVGKKSTVHMKIPKVQEDGTFTVNGTTYRLSNQLTDAPIRKVTQNKVVLSSAYGRAFITTADYARNNYTSWICDSIMALAQDTKSNIKAINIGDCTEQTKAHSKAVSSIKTRYRLIQTNEYTFYFDDVLCKEIIKEYPRTGHYWCGLSNKDKTILVGLDKNDFVFLYDKAGNIKPLAHIEEVLGIDRNERPIEYAMFNTAGVELPLGIVMASIYGMDNLLNMLSSEIRKIPRSMWNKEPISLDEWYLDFADTRLVFKNSDRITEIIMGGFSKYHKSIKEHELEFFDKAGSLATMLSKTNMGALADSEIRNIRFMDDMFVDPITEEILTIMKEPTSFRGLLHRSAELLSTGDYTREFMLKGQMRISGYERFSMAIYKELTNAVRMQARAIGRQNKPISLNPNSVWMNITSDPAKSVVNDINPIEYLKGAELLTFSGHGGRSKETMVASTRLYDDSYMGVVSEATVDSGDVGIRSYLCVNPDIKDIYGFTGDKQDFKPTSVYSTSALLFANSDKDD